MRHDERYVEGVDYDEDELTDDDGEEWQEGQCDMCFGETVDGPLGPIYCACTIGQGAPSDECQCGPEED